MVGNDTEIAPLFRPPPECFFIGRLYTPALDGKGFAGTSSQLDAVKRQGSSPVLVAFPSLCESCYSISGPPWKVLNSEPNTVEDVPV